jgi:hypothetical protein
MFDIICPSRYAKNISAIINPLMPMNETNNVEMGPLISAMSPTIDYVDELNRDENHRAAFVYFGIGIMNCMPSVCNSAGAPSPTHTFTFGI